MKSVQINRYGNSEVIEINQNSPSLNISSEKILGNVKILGVNPIDWKIREGYMQQITPLQFPSTLGMDFLVLSKKQISNYPYSSDFKQGDEVYGEASAIKEGSGAFAEMVITNVDNIALKPEKVNYT